MTNTCIQPREEKQLDYIYNGCALTGSSLIPSLRATDWYTVLKLIGMPHFFARTWKGMQGKWRTIDIHGKKYNTARCYSSIKRVDSFLLENLRFAICLYCNTNNTPNLLCAVRYMTRWIRDVTCMCIALEVSDLFLYFCGSPNCPVFVKNLFITCCTTTPLISINLTSDCE